MIGWACYLSYLSIWWMGQTYCNLTVNLLYSIYLLTYLLYGGIWLAPSAMTSIRPIPSKLQSPPRWPIHLTGIDLSIIQDLSIYSHLINYPSSFPGGHSHRYIMYVMLCYAMFPHRITTTSLNTAITTLYRVNKTTENRIYMRLDH